MALTMTALTESPAPVSGADPVPATDGHQDPAAAERPATPAATGHQHGSPAPAQDTPADKAETAPPGKKKPAKDKGGAKPPAALYECPMHPEVQSPNPGRCPKCGMKLVPKVDTRSADKGHKH